MWICAEKQAYPTNTDITFLAVAEVPDPVEFLWHFGDSGSVRTTSRTVTRRYHKPGRYETQKKTKTPKLFRLVSFLYI